MTALVQRTMAPATVQVRAGEVTLWARTRPPLSRDQEVALIARWQQDGDEKARELVVEANLRFVLSWVYEHAASRAEQYHLAIEDVIQAGSAGLLEAMDKFDTTKGFKFITYAVWWIRVHVNNYIYANNRCVRLPTSLRDLLTSFRKAQRNAPRTWSEEEVIKSMNLPFNREHDLRTAIKTDVHLDGGVIGTTPGNNSPHTSVDLVSRSVQGPEATLHEHLELPSPFTHYDEQVDVEYAQETIQSCLGHLSHIEAAIVRLYYGLWGEKQHTLEEIGRLFNLTRERIRQLKVRALKKLTAADEPALKRAYDELN